MYRKVCRCSNCDAVQAFKIPKGEFLGIFLLKKKLCEICGCETYFSVLKDGK